MAAAAADHAPQTPVHVGGARCAPPATYLLRGKSGAGQGMRSGGGGKQRHEKRQPAPAAPAVASASASTPPCCHPHATHLPRLSSFLTIRSSAAVALNICSVIGKRFQIRLPDIGEIERICGEPTDTCHPTSPSTATAAALVSSPTPTHRDVGRRQHLAKQRAGHECRVLRLGAGAGGCMQWVAACISRCSA